MNSSDVVREKVSEAYARAVQSPAGSECCGAVQQKGVAAKLGGYRCEELSSVPENAVVNSLGSGDPVAVADLRPGDVVVDLGCGAGLDLLLAGERVGPEGRVIGIDMTDAMIDAARSNIEAAGRSNVEVRKGIIEHLPVEDGSVDWVISNCVINLSPEKERVFGEIARILKPGGRVSISDIVVTDLPDRVRIDARHYSSCVAGAIDEHAYIDGLRGAGLTDIEVASRVLYDSDQIGCLMGSGESQDAQAGSCCHTTGSIDQSLLADITGKIWSAQFMARKPR
jgi:SAM-dependent methyltransferase